MIFRNITEEPIYGTLFRYLGYEYWVEKQDTILIIFDDDDSICDTKNEYIDKHYIFDKTEHVYPLHFKTDKIELFYKTPIELNGRKSINFKPIFKNCTKIKHKIWEDSIFNMIYQDIDMNEVFSLIKIKSNEEKPRYLMAYDETIFCKSDIIYLIENMFRLSFE